jgi:AraC-like DNA-binding protein
MSFVFDIRGSDSPFVDWVWRTESHFADSFISTAENHSEIVITRYKGQTSVTLRGPETVATTAEFPAGAVYFGIVFKHGTFLPHFPAVNLLDRHDEYLPVAMGNAFWLKGATWEIPNFDNADTFIERLARQEIIVADPIVRDVLENRPLDMSVRTAQRRFLRATGLTVGTFAQIERAQQAVKLLGRGLSIADAVYYAGYADQPHLTRSLKRFFGQTPGQILQSEETE